MAEHQFNENGTRDDGTQSSVIVLLEIPKDREEEAASAADQPLPLDDLNDGLMFLAIPCFQ